MLMSYWSDNLIQSYNLTIIVTNLANKTVSIQLKSALKLELNPDYLKVNGLTKKLYFLLISRQYD